MTDMAYSIALPKKIGVVIPAHNEAARIGACLASIQQAVMQLPSGIAVQVVVVLDSCEDATLDKVKQAGVDYLCCAFRCVGKVRDLGVRSLIEQGATWIACTDADTVVAADWLTQQLTHLEQAPVSMICGVVSVDSWQGLSDTTREQYLAHYQDRMDHRHIHGANLSFASRDYVAVGGFDAIGCHEDVGLVKKFEHHQLPIVWSNAVRVITSSRLLARAQQGFAHFLNKLEQSP